LFPSSWGICEVFTVNIASKALPSLPPPLPLSFLAPRPLVLFGRIVLPIEGIVSAEAQRLSWALEEMEGGREGGKEGEREGGAG
jgi:hypothetical protein